METLKSSSLKRSNNYSKIETEFNKRGYNLLKQKFTKVPSWLNEKITVISPCYNVKRSLKKLLLALESQIYRNFEVICVDDGSKEKLESVIKSIKCTYPLKYVKNTRNRDRPYAKNTALSIAEGTTISAIDSDMVPHKYYLLNLAIRQALTKGCLFVAFKEHLDCKDKRASDKNIISGKANPDYKKDWRWYRKYDCSIYPPNFLQKKEKKSRMLRIVKETDYFKKLGKDNVCCAWDISSLAVGHGICFKKEDGIRVGGFAEKFVGWGPDDVAFGIRMVANGIFIVPCIASSAFHINHKPHSGSWDAKMKDFRRNLGRYLGYVNTPLKKIRFIPKRVKLLRKRKNKYYYRGP